MSVPVKSFVKKAQLLAKKMKKKNYEKRETHEIIPKFNFPIRAGAFFDRKQ